MQASIGRLCDPRVMVTAATQCIASCVAMAWAADLSPKYAGAQVCGQCHLAEYDLQSQSAHARTLAPSAGAQPGDWGFGAGRLPEAGRTAGRGGTYGSGLKSS